MNMLKPPSVCVTAILVTLSASVARADSEPLGIQEVDLLLAQFVDLSNPGLARTASMELRAALRSGAPEVKARIQAQLTDLLGTVREGLDIRRICAVASEAPIEQMIAVLLQRLRSESNQSTALSIAVCDGLRLVVSGLRTLPASVAAAVRDDLESILGNQATPQALIDAAEMAAASLGPMGFDLLLSVQSRGENHRLSNVLYSALAATRDGRALPIFRAALADSTTHEGLRIQAVNAMGQLIGSLQKAGTPIDTPERAACAQVLDALLTDDTPDQLFSVAIRSSAKLAGTDQNPGFRQIVLKALRAASEFRREAALDVLYLTNDSWAQNGMSTVQSLAADTESNEGIRAGAQALLDKWSAEAQLAGQ